MKTIRTRPVRTWISVGMGLVLIAVLAGYAFAGSGCGACGKEDTKGSCEPQAVTAVKVEHAEINTEGLAALLRAEVPLTVLDARSGKWDDGRRIPGAIALAPDAKEEEVKRVLPDRKRLIVTYCGGLTCPASAKLAERLREIGYENVLEYAEGIAGWVERGNKVETRAAPEEKR